MTAQAFVEWLANAKPGDSVEYHRGNLASDRDSLYSRLTADTRMSIIKLAGRALRAWDDKLVYLVQKRNGPDDFSYLAIKTRGRK